MQKACWSQTNVREHLNAGGQSRFNWTVFGEQVRRERDRPLISARSADHLAHTAQEHEYHSCIEGQGCIKPWYVQE